MTECPFLSDLASVKQQISEWPESMPLTMRPGEVVVWRCMEAGCRYKIVQSITEETTVDLYKDYPEDLLRHSVFNVHPRLKAEVPA